MSSTSIYVSVEIPEIETKKSTRVSPGGLFLHKLVRVLVYLYCFRQTFVNAMTALAARTFWLAEIPRILAP